MKFIHLGDLHIGRSFDLYPLLADQKFVLEQVVQVALAQKVSSVLIAGDLYDRSVPKEEAVELYNDFISTLVLEHHLSVYAISGNHDSAIRTQGMNRLLKKSGYTIVGEISNPLEIIEIEDEHGLIHLYMMPYKDLYSLRSIFGSKEKDDINDLLEGIMAPSRQDPCRKILMAHHYFGTLGQPLDESDSERRLYIGGQDLLDASKIAHFDYVALGHLHRGQKVGADHVRYAGTLLKYSTSEVHHKKQITVVTMDGQGQCHLDFFPVAMKRDVKKIRGTFLELSRRDFLEKKDDFLAVTLTDETPVDDAFARLSHLYPSIISLEYEFKQQGEDFNLDQEALKQEDSRKLFADFFREKNGRTLKPEEEDFMQDIFEKLEEHHDSN